LDSHDYARAIMEVEEMHWIAGEPWIARSGVLSPVSPPHKPPQASELAIRQAIRQSKAYGARWTYQWDGPPSQWWWIICDDRQYDVTRLSRRGRKGVRRGLRQCTVHRVETSWLAENGYQVYLAAHQRYENFQPDDAETFRESLITRASLEDFHSWGVFVEDRLIAHGTCVILDGCAVILTNKSDPDALQFNPNNALFYEITRYYLREMGLCYVTAGSQNVYHASAIHDFLQQMGYRRAYARLGLLLRHEIELATRARVGKVGELCERLKIMPGLARKVVAVDRLWQIAHST
jgi:hypothetical protein